MANQEETRSIVDEDDISTNARLHMCLMSAMEGMRLKESEGGRYPDMSPHVPQEVDWSRPRKTLVLRDDEGVDIPTNPKSKSAKGYIARQRVSISGLISDVSLNGRQGTLVEWSDKTQRWLVNVDEKEDFVRVKPANLELVRPSPDKPRYWPAGVHIRELVFDIESHPPVAKLARRETGDEDEVNGNAETADERPLTDEELGSRVLFSGALIDLRGELKLATVVSLYSRKAYEGEDWEAEKFHLQKIQKGLSPQHWSAHVGTMANNGRVVMLRCENMGDTMYCGREPRRHGWLEYEPETGLNQLVGRVLHETWTPRNDEKLWTVKDLCEVVLSRYRKKRTPSFKPGSWLFGARARVACDDDEDDPDPENLSTRLTLSKHCGDASWGAWAICGRIPM